MKYHYYAIFEKDEDGYSISFPDLPGCLTCAKDIEEALKMAKDVLEGYQRKTMTLLSLQALIKN